MAAPEISQYEAADRAFDLVNRLRFDEWADQKHERLTEDQEASRERLSDRHRQDAEMAVRFAWTPEECSALAEKNAASLARMVEQHAQDSAELQAQVNTQRGLGYAIPTADFRRGGHVDDHGHGF